MISRKTTAVTAAGCRCSTPIRTAGCGAVDLAAAAGKFLGGGGGCPAPRGGQRAGLAFPGPEARSFDLTSPRRNRPASLQCAGLAFVSRARSFDLEVTAWAPSRLTSCIFHSGHTEAYEPLRSTRYPARTPFRDLAAPESARKPPVCRSGISRARSFDLEVTPWAPSRLTTCIFHSGHTEAYEPLRSTRYPAHTPFRDLAAPESARKPPACRSGISRARSFDLEVTAWAPSRLTSCIFHSGHTEAYEPLRSTRYPARTPFRDLAAPESARKPPVCRSGISRARSFDLEVTPWAPTRLTSCIFHSGHTEAYEPLRSTRYPAHTPFRDLAAPESARKPPACRSGISRARSFDLEVTAWAPSRLTSCIFRSGHTEAYE
eukprot:COSAG04_NODE_109_length_25931_cov_38.787279_24_plen_374_part_01